MCSNYRSAELSTRTTARLSKYRRRKQGNANDDSDIGDRWYCMTVLNSYNKSKNHTHFHQQRICTEGEMCSTVRPAGSKVVWTELNFLFAAFHTMNLKDGMDLSTIHIYFATKTVAQTLSILLIFLPTFLKRRWKALFIENDLQITSFCRKGTVKRIAMSYFLHILVLKTTKLVFLFTEIITLLVFKPSAAIPGKMVPHDHDACLIGSWIGEKTLTDFRSGTYIYKE